MVDRAARDAYAQVLRHFAAGLINVDEYEDRYDQIPCGLPHDDTYDPALQHIFWAVWMCYDDFRTDRLRGKYALHPETRRVIARVILFLYSDREYAWPRDSMFTCLCNLLTLGLYGLVMRPIWERQARKVGDMEFWPFTSRAEEEEERRRPRLLVGQR